ncbi:hypothetical protein COLO4_25576 [Corchorus olitorius]|uniref:Uncharacterized protein n=1 Tax=Corchorus olitorius TaxID=93759 RepID=A0A1R3I1G0_9ROSI|nr:hypothetical protein COLO4_25576 [Corchorus olitorius]
MMPKQLGASQNRVSTSSANPPVANLPVVDPHVVDPPADVVNPASHASNTLQASPPYTWRWDLLTYGGCFSDTWRPLSAGSVPCMLAFPLPFASHNAFDWPAADGCLVVLRLSLV